MRLGVSRVRGWGWGGARLRSSKLSRSVSVAKRLLPQGFKVLSLILCLYGSFASAGL